jgi:hypothetical protein
MRIGQSIPPVERKEIPKIQEKAKPELEPTVNFQRGYVKNVDASKFEGIDLAVNQRTISRNGFIEMRKSVDRVPSSVGRYSRDRQSSQFGVADPVNSKLRLEPRPGQQAAVFQESKVAQQLDIQSYQNARIPAIEGARIGKSFLKNSENLNKQSYQKLEELLQVSKRAIDILT